MRVWWEYGSNREDGSVKIYYYVFFLDRYFSTYIIKNIKNKKRWKPERMITVRKLKFSPIIRSNGSVISEFTSFEVDNDKIKLDIPCPK